MKLDSKTIFLGFIIVFTIVVTVAEVAVAYDAGIYSISIPQLVGGNFVYALLIGGVPFIIYHFIIGDKKKKRTEWKCEHCKFKTGTEENMKEHYKSQHSDEKDDSFHRKYGNQ